ncbi:MAG: sialidase family protein [Solirubrobacteraceae bacterium]
MVVLALAAALVPSAYGRVGFHRPVTLPKSRDGTEPSIAISARGVRYPSWQVPGEFAHSRDGIHFTQKGMHPIPDDTASGDVSNAVDRAGAIYNGQICGDASNSLHACVYRSTNRGRTWRETQLADNNPGASDRPWIAVHSDPKAPRNPDRDTVYLEYHTFSPDDLTYVTVSHDGGASFGTPIPLPDTAASAQGSACNTYPGGIVVDQSNGNAYAVWNSGNDAFASTSSGCNYTSLGPFTKAWVATSTDGGASWTAHLAWQGRYNASTHVGDDNDMGFVSIAVDRGHQVHVAMAVRQHNDPVQYTAKCTVDPKCQQTPQVTDLELVTSPDRGRHWTRAVHLSRHRGSYFFPYVVAGSAGRVGIDYYVTRSLRPNDPKDVWYVGFSEIHGAVAKLAGGRAGYAHHPRVTVEAHLDRHPVHRGGICTLGIFCPVVPNSNRNLADNIALAVTPAGGVEAAWTNDFNPKATTRVDYACQNAGTSLYAGRHPLRGCYGQRLPRRTERHGTRRPRPTPFTG